LQVKWAEAEFGAHLCERDGLVQMLLYVATDGLDQLLARISAYRVRPAAEAFTIPGFLGFLRAAEESHILAARALGRTRWPAIHAGGGNGKDKFAVAGGVAGEDGLPSRVDCFSECCGPVCCGRQFRFR